MDFQFRSIQDEKDVARLERFLLSQSLNYPDYEDWVRRAVEETLAGYKQGIMAFNGEFLVGDLIFQPHKELPRTLELKNLRIHPKVKRRGFAYFMLKQAEAQNGYNGIICDVRASQISVVNLLKLMDYKEVFRAPLYDSREEDIVFVKSLKAA
jgi:ribosomal protein S18 acetylase RimI-like enzyme